MKMKRRRWRERSRWRIRHVLVNENLVSKCPADFFFKQKNVSIWMDARSILKPYNTD